MDKLTEKRIVYEMETAQKLYDNLHFNAQFMNFEALWEENWGQSEFWRMCTEDPIGPDLFFNWADWLSLFASAYSRSEDKGQPGSRVAEMQKDVRNALNMAGRARASLPDIYYEAKHQKGGYMISLQTVKLLSAYVFLSGKLERREDIEWGFETLAATVENENAGFLSHADGTVPAIFSVLRQSPDLTAHDPRMEKKLAKSLDRCVAKLEQIYKTSRSPADRDYVLYGCLTASQIMQSLGNDPAAKAYTKKAAKSEKTKTQ